MKTRRAEVEGMTTFGLSFISLMVSDDIVINEVSSVATNGNKPVRALKSASPRAMVRLVPLVEVVTLLTEDNWTVWVGVVSWS